MNDIQKKIHLPSKNIMKTLYRPSTPTDNEFNLWIRDVWNTMFSVWDRIEHFNHPLLNSALTEISELLFDWLESKTTPSVKNELNSRVYLRTIKGLTSLISDMLTQDIDVYFTQTEFNSYKTRFFKVISRLKSALLEVRNEFIKEICNAKAPQNLTFVRYILEHFVAGPYLVLNSCQESALELLRNEIAEKLKYTPSRFTRIKPKSPKFNDEADFKKSMSQKIVEGMVFQSKRRRLFLKDSVLSQLRKERSELVKKISSMQGDGNIGQSDELTPDAEEEKEAEDDIDTTEDSQWEDLTARLISLDTDLLLKEEERDQIEQAILTEYRNISARPWAPNTTSIRLRAVYAL